MKLKQSILLIICMFTVFLFACGEKASIAFKDSALNVEVNQEFELTPEVTGKNVEVVYSYDTEAFELISGSKFKALAEGEYEIVASLKGKEDLKATITIKVAHTHAFDQKVATDAYLASKATCTEKAKYYYSCTCGEKGTETFEDGDLVAHKFDQKVATDAYLASKATCTEKAKYYYSCTCGEKGTETFEDGDLEEHKFDQKVATDAYLASKATCTEKAKYYYSCTCGEKGTETFEDGDLEEHKFDQKVVDDKFAADESGIKYYYSCTCGEKGTEVFFNINPTEVAVTVVDDDIASMEIGSTYQYNNVEYIVGLTAFATIADGLKYATETVYVAGGTYNEVITISKSNIKFLGNNANINPNLKMRNEESAITNKLNLAQDAKNITISGFCFTLDAQVIGAAKGGNDDIVFEYNLFDNEITTASGYPDGGEVMMFPTTGNYNKNFTVRYNRFLSTGGKTYHLMIRNLENLTVHENYFEGTYAQAYADSIMFDDTANYGATGDILIENNEFYNIAQYVIIFWDYYAVNLKVIGNKFTNCGVDGAGDGYVRGVVTLINALSKADKSIVLIEKNVMENVDTCVRIQYLTPEKIEVTVRYNKFISWAESEVITNNGTGTGAVINAEYNYFGQEVSDANFKAVTSWANKYDNIDDVPEYEREEQVYITELEITNKVDELPAYSKYQLEYSYKPENVTTNKIIFKSSDEAVATVNDRGLINVLGSGKVTIYAYSANNEEIVDSFEFEVKSRSMVDASYEGNGVLRPNETLTINAVVKGEENPAKIEFVSSDPTIAEVDENGVVTAINEGTVNITIKSGELETVVALTILAEGKELSELMQLLIENNNGTVFYDEVDYIGYEAGFEKVPHKVYGAVNAYWASELPEVIKNMVPTTNANYTGQYMTSVEYVVIHDTGAANPAATAKANSGWCTNPTNDGTSWHYTIGNDGIYQQLEDNMIAWHAGDWSQKNPGKFAWFDTGIKFDQARPTVTVGDDGYFYINGAKSLIEAPRKEDGSLEKNINKVGLVCVKGENGNYMLPTTWISDESGYPVCVYGGNSNGIGIETCVNSASDLWLTWQYSAKFSAQLLVKHGLYSDRLVFHNNFTNKTCPNTMITNGLVDEFLRLVEVEYRIAKEFSDYQITFTSHNPEILDNSGRIINAPDYTTNVSYTITVSKDGVTEEVTLNSLVPGRFGLESEGVANPELTVNQGSYDINVGDSAKLDVTCSTGAKLVWESSDTNVVTVVDGVIKGVNAGQATITVSIENTDIKAEITVNVIKVETGYDYSKLLVAQNLEGTEVEVNGVKYYAGETAFTSVNEALAKALDGAEIYILAGTYEITELINVDKAITLVGPNADKKVNDERVEEAIFTSDNYSTGSFVPAAANITFNGLGFMGIGNSGYPIQAGEVLENFTIKSCYFENVNTVLCSYASTQFKGTLTITETLNNNSLQFLAWIDGASELVKFEYTNNKVYGEVAEHFAGKGMISFRATDSSAEILIENNEFDFANYTLASNPFYALSGSIIVKNNKFTGLTEDKLFHEGTVEARTVEGNEYSTSESIKIADVVAGEDGVYEVTAVVVGVNARSFLIKDETGVMLVYLGKNYAQDLKVGDKVKVTGTTSVYGKAKQFGEDAVYEKVSETTVNHGTAKELTAADCDAYAALEVITPEYVKVVGTLAVSGSYFNLTIEGATIIGSLTYLVNADELKAYDDEKVEVYGYVTGTASKDKYLNFMVTEVKEVKEEVVYDYSKLLVATAFDGSELKVNGVKYYVGETAFTSVNEALAKALDGAEIYILAGTYEITELINVDKAITFVGPNADKKVNDERVEEAIFTSDNYNTGSFVPAAANITFNGLGFMGIGNSGYPIQAGEVLENFTIKSCYFENVNTVLCSFASTQFKGTLTITETLNNNSLQFLAWIDGASELVKFEYTNNKVYGEVAEHFAGKGMISFRATDSSAEILIENNEFDFANYTLASNPFYALSGSIVVKNNKFTGLTEDKLFHEGTVESRTVEGNEYFDEMPVIEGEAGIGYSLDFAELSNKVQYAEWSKAEKYQGMSAIGNPGQSYLGYAGFARSGDSDSTIITKALVFASYFQVTMDVKGNGTKDGSHFLVKALDKDGNVIATGVVLSDSASASTVGDTKGMLASGADSTVVFAFGEAQFEAGKTFADVAHIAVNYIKVTGNMGWKAISIEALN